MLMKIFAGMLINGLLSKQKEIVENAMKEQAVLELKERARKYFLAHVTNTIAREYIENSKSYVKSLELMELEIDIPPQQIQDLLYRFDHALESFEKEFEQRAPNQVSTEEILKTLPPREKRLLGGQMQPPQVSPSLAYINKVFSRPAEYQPYFLMKHREDLVEKVALDLWNEILELHFPDTD